MQSLMRADRCSWESPFASRLEEANTRDPKRGVITESRRVLLIPRQSPQPKPKPLINKPPPLNGAFNRDP